jgi:hypothetical protein
VRVCFRDRHRSALSSGSSLTELMRGGILPALVRTRRQEIYTSRMPKQLHSWRNVLKKHRSSHDVCAAFLASSASLFPSGCQLWLQICSSSRCAQTGITPNPWLTALLILSQDPGMRLCCTLNFSRGPPKLIRSLDLWRQSSRPAF